MPRVLRHSLNIKGHRYAPSVLCLFTSKGLTFSMVQTAEAEAFLHRIASLPRGPGINLDEVLQPSLDDETELRRLLATDRSNARLSNPYVGIVDVFEAPSDIRTTRARVVKDDRDLNAKHVMPVPEDKRRKEGEPCMVSDLDEFKRNWSIFSEGSLSQLKDWSNVIAAGGSVLACLAPLSDADKASKRAIRKYYHSAAYPTSDIDLFLWGLTSEQAEKKIVTIYEAVRDSVPWDVTCVRTKNAISIHSQYPYRSVQIVLRLYQSPAEILAGFDIDAPCCAYDGARVWANPRAIVAMMRQCNTTDVTRRSPSYEVRLSKYARRGFEIYVPSLVRADIDPTIFERSIVRVEGLARILVLEQLATFDERQSFLRARRDLRGRPGVPWRSRKMKRKYRNDLKSLAELEELDMNDYDVGSLHIPYGPGWDARRTDRLIYQTDLGMNSTFNPKNKGRRLHRHPAFFGTIEECMEDCCECCHKPIDEAERELQTKEDEVYIRGRVSFVQENPGRQIITGSFNPIDAGEWSAQVYIGPTERLFSAIAAHDRSTVINMIKEGVDLSRRDHVGRSPLHFAILCNATEITCDFVDAGARMTARLVDGRTSLHLAIQHDQVTVVRKLLERSAQNQEAAKAGTKEESDDEKKSERERPSSEDDWSSEDDGVMEIGEEEADDEDGMDEDEDNDDENNKKKPSKGREEEKREAPTGDEIPDDNTNEPDVFDLNAADWDFGLNPLAYAIIFASVSIIEDLIAAGVDVKASTQNNTLDVHPLALTMLRLDEDEACAIAERLILGGATSSPADGQFRTIFYRIVAAKKVKLASTIMRCDPNINAVINSPRIVWGNVIIPLVLAIHERDYAMTAALLAYGARLEPLEEDITKAIATRPTKDTRFLFQHDNLLTQAYRPLETALNRHDDIVQLLISLGADFNTGILANYTLYAKEDEKQSILDWVNVAIQAMEMEIKRGQKAKEPKPVDFSKLTSWKEYATLTVKITNGHLWCHPRLMDNQVTEVERMESTKQYFEDVKELLVSLGAKTWAGLDVEKKLKSDSTGRALLGLNYAKPDLEKETSFEDYEFAALSRYHFTNLPRYLIPRYHELCEACFNGDNEKIQALCLPPEGAQHNETPLQITAILRDSQGFGSHVSGLTPFSIAVERRKWDTARLVLAIAVAQYEADEEEVVFSVDDIDIDDDGSDYSYDSDATVEQKNKENLYVDVAKRPSTIKCDVKPGLLFTTPRRYGYVVDGNYQPETVLDKAIREDDLEAFVKLLNMLINLPIPESIPNNLTQLLLSYDRLDMLDELIRRVGTGIDLKTVRHEAKDAIPVNDQNKLYLGLKVHGKKRADLARKNDPNAGVDIQESPLLWRALQANAEKVVDYLASERAYSAYRSYAASHSDERAERLRTITNLKELLPQWLGFRTNSLGESPLTAAALSGKVGLLKVLFAKHKDMMKAALHDKYKISDLNILQIAVRAYVEVDTELLDFLLAKNVSPLETDVIGQNPYHFLCKRDKHRLLEHLLKKLSSDVNEALFKQQTRGKLKTPLHLAVEARSIKTVELLLARSHVANTIRDSDGCLPLHIAVRCGSSRIAKMLVDASPSTLFMEDGVGSTAAESATITLFRERMNHFSQDTFNLQVATSAPTTANKDPERFDLARLEKELPRLRETIDSLLKVGKLRKDTKLEKGLLGFAEKMEGHKRRLQQAPVAVEREKEILIDVQDHSATYDVIKEALNYVEGERQLVHLLDVQESIVGSLTCIYRTKNNTVEDDMLKEEAEAEMSFVAVHAFVDIV
ncbi:ankyrin repeat protein [Amanita rubescens]|nr:ankyrin repeat protein [Amanita rubescens]